MKEKEWEAYSNELKAELDNKDQMISILRWENRRLKKENECLKKKHKKKSVLAAVIKRKKQ